MDYSKLVSISLVNFMSFRKAKLEFDESGILNIKGYNHSGKSGILKGIAVCILNMYPTKQSKYIHHGKEFFRIRLDFDDGVAIIRDKYINGQSLYEMHKNDAVIFTTKVGNKLSKVDGVPKPIADYLGLVATELGCLNYQTRRDPLWLVETKGSENYQSLNETLKTEEISRANALNNSDMNKMIAEITELERDIQQTQMLIDSYSDASEALLSAMLTKEAEVQSMLSRKDVVEAVVSIVDELSKIRVAPEVQPIDFSKGMRIASIQSLVSELVNTPRIPQIVGINGSRLQKVEKLVNDYQSYQKTMQGTYLHDIGRVDSDRMLAVAKLSATVDKIVKVQSALDELDDKGFKAEKMREGILQEADALGIKYVVCGNCGSIVEVK